MELAENMKLAEFSVLRRAKDTARWSRHRPSEEKMQLAGSRKGGSVYTELCLGIHNVPLHLRFRSQLNRFCQGLRLRSILERKGTREVRITAATHEDFSRTQEMKGSSNRSFGLVFGVFFALMGLLPLRAHHEIRWWALALSASVLVLGFLRPGWLGPFNRVWTKLGLLLGNIANPIVTGLLFYLIVTPTGFVFRLCRKDVLRLASDAAASSYWIERRPPGPPPGTMANQF